MLICEYREKILKATEELQQIMDRLDASTEQVESKDQAEFELLSILYWLGKKNPSIIDTIKNNISARDFFNNGCRDLFINFFSRLDRKKSIEMQDMVFAIRSISPEFREVLTRVPKKNNLYKYLHTSLKEIKNKQWLWKIKFLEQELQPQKNNHFDLLELYVNYGKKHSAEEEKKIIEEQNKIIEEKRIKEAQAELERLRNNPPFVDMSFFKEQ